MTQRRLWGVIGLTGLVLALANLAQACTGIQVKTMDGAVVTGRTMEFGFNVESEIIIIPRGKTFTGTAPGGKSGLQWTGQYGVAGLNGLNLPFLVDGINEKGLGIGLFYFPGFAEYQAVPQGSAARALAPWEFGTYLLMTCANVEEAVRAAREVFVGASVLPAWNAVPPAHFRLQDASGKGAVLEYVGGQLNVYDNPVGVITNAPTFDWHMTNLRNHLNVSPTSVRPRELAGLELTPLGQGSGMLGLPGDFTPPSRFIRAVAFSRTAAPVGSAAEGVKQVFHILNNFDIPLGSVKDRTGQANDEYTQWTSVSDLTGCVFYFRTYDNSRIRMVELKNFNLNASDIKTIPIKQREEFEQVTATAN
jgi:choloylglycine hydrolase